MAISSGNAATMGGKGHSSTSLPLQSESVLFNPSQPGTSSPPLPSNLSTSSTSPSPEEEAFGPELAATWLKIKMADHLRLTQDNQEILDMTLAQDKTLRQQRHNLREVQAAKLGAKPTPLNTEAEADMGDRNISVDSPVYHHYYPPPPQPQPVAQAPVAPVAPAAPSKLSTVLPWVLAAAATGGLGFAIVKPLLDGPAPSGTTTINKVDGFLIDLQQSKEKQYPKNPGEQ